MFTIKNVDHELFKLNEKNYDGATCDTKPITEWPDEDLQKLQRIIISILSTR